MRWGQPPGRAHRETGGKRMSPVRILTDTTACIPAAIASELAIEIVPFRIVRGDEILRDMVDVHPAEFAAYLETAQSLPTTTGPSPSDYEEALERVAQTTREIVVLTMTWKATGAPQSCRAALGLVQERYPDLQVES